MRALIDITDKLIVTKIMLSCKEDLDKLACNDYKAKDKLMTVVRNLFVEYNVETKTKIRWETAGNGSTQKFLGFIWNSKLATENLKVIK
jgi:hypothetical protein